MHDRPDAVILFAAGFGTRMGALTRDRPKPLVSVAGQTLLDHALALAAGVPRKVVNAHYLAGQIVDHLADRPDIAVSVEQPDILDTGGGLRAALPLLAPNGQPGGPVFTMNTDAVWTGPNPFTTLGQAWRPASMDALLLLIPASRATGHAGAGDFGMDASGRLSRGGDLVYTGAQIVRTDALGEIPQAAFSLNLLWDRFATAGRLFGAVHTGGWCDVGRPEGIALAEGMLRLAPQVRI